MELRAGDEHGGEDRHQHDNYQHDKRKDEDAQVAGETNQMEHLPYQRAYFPVTAPEQDNCSPPSPGVRHKEQ